jgi:hypothetical protein
MHRSPQERSNGPVIIFNEVTYRSPDEMPEDVRAIWDLNERRWQAQGTDWREQKCIVISWSNEGGRTKQSVKMQGRSQVTHIDAGAGPWTLVRVIGTAYLICFFALAIYGALWDDPPLVRATDSVLLRLAYCLLVAPGAWLIWHEQRRRRRQATQPQSRIDELMALHLEAFPKPAASKWKSAGMGVGALVAGLVMTYFAAFMGVAKLLHYAERQPGEAMATVSAKHAYSRKGARCAPRVEFKEFRPSGDQLCVDAAFFNGVRVGDQVRIGGQVSRYAIEPDLLGVANQGSSPI